MQRERADERCHVPSKHTNNKTKKKKITNPKEKHFLKTSVILQFNPSSRSIFTLHATLEFTISLSLSISHKASIFITLSLLLRLFPLLGFVSLHYSYQGQSLELSFLLQWRSCLLSKKSSLLCPTFLLYFQAGTISENVLRINFFKLVKVSIFLQFYYFYNSFNLRLGHCFVCLSVVEGSRLEVKLGFFQSSLDL